MSPWRGIHPSSGHRPGRKHYFRITMSVCRAEQRFSVKGQIANVAQLCRPCGYLSQLLSYRCEVKAAIDNKERNEHGCVPIKLYF